jgi:RNA polymerase sigma-70 factor (ECF subfamily)
LVQRPRLTAADFVEARSVSADWRDGDLALCLRGDAQAWASFAERFVPVIHSAVNRTLSTYGSGAQPGNAEDVVQAVFVRLLENDRKLLRSYDPARSSLATWLGLISRSTAIDQLRRRGSHRRGDASAVAPASQDCSPPKTPKLPAIPEGLLSGRQQLVLHLIFDRDMDVPEVADLLGVEPQTVRSTKHKAIDRLRRHFGASR